MKEVKVQKRFKCDFCKFRSVKHIVAIHEKRCFRNPNRFCDYCENKGFTTEYYEDAYASVKTDCPYCSKFNKKQLEEIQARENQ